METTHNKEPVTPEESLIPYKLFGPRVIIEYLPPEKLIDSEAGTVAIDGSKSGLVRAASQEDPYSKGKVMVVGQGTQQNPVLVKPGWIIHYFRQQRVPGFEIEGKEYDLIGANDCFGLL